MPIDRTLSKLMTEDRVTAFDHLEAQFHKVRDGLPQLWSRKEMSDLSGRLAALKAQMERPRYYVGFLGRSQVGKSSTLNSILEAPLGEGPGTGGAGAPMTSNITRLYRLEPSEGTEHRVTLRYMTPEQFKRRRDDLCSFLGFRLDETNEAVLAQLDELLRREKQDPDADGRPANEKTEDRGYLATLLRSYARYSNQVTNPPLVQAGEYAKRKEYTNHPRDQGAWPYLLVAQVEIGYRTEAISPKIELIDLPGLGARLFSDDRLTETFLPQLDGALVFQSSEQVAAKEAYDLLAKLGGQFRRMQGRVWMIFTRFDGLTRDHFGAGSELNILDNIVKTLSDNKVPSEQVLLVGNEFHKQLLTADGKVQPPSPELLRAVLKLDLDADGKPLIPEGFKRHEALAAAYREVMKDGGIGKIREVIGEALAEKVEGEVREAVDTEMRGLRSDLARLLRSAQEAMRMDSGGFRRAVQWRVRLQQARQALDGNRQVLEAPTLEVVLELQKEFDEGLCPPTLSLNGAKLFLAHKGYARVLRDQTSLKYRTEVVPAVFGWITDRLREAQATLGDVRLNGQPNPLEAWRERSDRDLFEPAWLAPLTAFDEPPLFPGAANDVQLPIREYRTAISRKVETVCHRATLEVARRIKTHLDEIVDGLALLDEAENHVDTAAPALFQEILQALA